MNAYIAIFPRKATLQISIFDYPSPISLPTSDSITTTTVQLGCAPYLSCGHAVALGCALRVQALRPVWPHRRPLRRRLRGFNIDTLFAVRLLLASPPRLTFCPCSVSASTLFTSILTKACKNRKRSMYCTPRNSALCDNIQATISGRFAQTSSA